MKTTKTKQNKIFWLGNLLFVIGIITLGLVFEKYAGIMPSLDEY